MARSGIELVDVDAQAFRHGKHQPPGFGMVLDDLFHVWPADADVSEKIVEAAAAIEIRELLAQCAARQDIGKVLPDAGQLP